MGARLQRLVEPTCSTGHCCKHIIAVRPRIYICKGNGILGLCRHLGGTCTIALVALPLKLTGLLAQGTREAPLRVEEAVSGKLGAVREPSKSTYEVHTAVRARLLGQAKLLPDGGTGVLGKQPSQPAHCKVILRGMQRVEFACTRCRLGVAQCIVQ